ncbi:NAD(P)/FAD-dependent oxidoreductase [Halanaerobium sp. MA284_MarDTE_T2]|uniref:NAD(P)/FAD-dependent oxidoreductase n=1 Tax=Halanaerobium sp. MA284_MarDTE_T2 TaxID=2183913 RepID=UPI000DF241B8|nr:FAD-dependent oxidoreductase [Halanaerobium sp. MA284_MarDTE_T2]RCW44396.1 pyruvate/2-oxoglutarate dehydrogenase complex dihydrolipoamide dehydrogenase (E3) component [Halanaerobium sp. MA284_MarDTE_T2]
MMKKELVIIGAGPAGLAAALAAYEDGIEDILIIEREERPGGILNQCIHDGFGLHKFKEVLTGPEYAHRYIDKVREKELEIMTNTIVTELTDEKELKAFNENDGILHIKAEAVILAMGSRERTAGGISLPGDRPSGIYTAGLAQNLMNLQNIQVGKKIVILGSGDIGLIMARRLTLEGADVKAVLEIMPYSNGLRRNINQCLVDYNIPLKLSQTVIDVKGEDRLESVTAAEVDESFNPIEGTEYEIECDTLILSVGLIPENELSKKANVQLDDTTGGAVVKDNLETNVDGIFSCGNVLHVHDLVDFVSDEAEKAGKAAAEYIKKGHKLNKDNIFVEAGSGIGYVIPQVISKEKDQIFSMRVRKPDNEKTIKIAADGKILHEENFEKVNPSEMIKIKVSSEKFKPLEKSTIKVVAE